MSGARVDAVCFTLVAIGLVAWGVRRLRAAGAQRAAVRRPVAPADQEEVRRLSASGRERAAVALLRWRYGFTLADAVDARRDLAQNVTYPGSWRQVWDGLDRRLRAEVRALVREGRTEEALKILRTRVAVGIDDARELARAGTTPEER